jgi:uncharacterized protein (DUF1697 family)
MSKLRTLCCTNDFTEVETSIPSGNVVLDLPGPGHEVRRLLEAWLEAFRGKECSVVVAASPEPDAILPAIRFLKRTAVGAS